MRNGDKEVEFVREVDCLSYDGHLSIQLSVLIVLPQFCKKMWVSKHMDLPLTSNTEYLPLDYYKNHTL